jgi:hypothetical protein
MMFPRLSVLTSKWDVTVFDWFRVIDPSVNEKLVGVTTWFVKLGARADVSKDPDSA